MIVGVITKEGFVGPAVGPAALKDFFLPDNGNDLF